MNITPSFSWIAQPKPKDQPVSASHCWKLKTYRHPSKFYMSVRPKQVLMLIQQVLDFLTFFFCPF